MNIPTFNIDQDLQGKRIVLRASLNVPLEKGKVTSAFRIKRALSTMEALTERGAKVVVLAHIGRNPTDTLRPVWEEMRLHTHMNIHFCTDLVGEEAKGAVGRMKDGEVLVLENTRKDCREVENDEGFAKKLASYGDVYINDAFSASHRTHATIVGIPKHLPSFIGPFFKEEREGIDPARKPQGVSLAIIGGAKFFTKEPLLRHLAASYDFVFVGGAIANDFIKARGHNVGRSLVSGISDVSDLFTNEKVHIPQDVVVDQGEGKSEEKLITEIEDHEIIYDIGSRSLDILTAQVRKADFVLWNGPTGYFEGGFKDATERIAQTIANAQTHSVVGGGDTVAAIENLSLMDRFTYVSASGGAMLTYITDGTLVGIEALKLR